MPELPDLEVISGNLDKRFSGSIVEKIEFFNTKKTNTDPQEYSRLLEGNSVATISRDGKEICINFVDDNKLYLHLMREGKLDIANDESKKYKIVELIFENDMYLVMTDFMGQAKASLNPALGNVPDSLSPEFTLGYFREQIAKKKRSTIKGFLVDQKNIKGIGNAYADEILWHARVSPKTKCGDIPNEITDEIYKAIRYVLNNAIAQIREIEPGIISGEIRDFLVVHKKNTDKTTSGVTIHNEKISGKSTYYTDEQVLY